MYYAILVVALAAAICSTVDFVGAKLSEKSRLRACAKDALYKRRKYLWAILKRVKAEAHQYADKSYAHGNPRWGDLAQRDRIQGNVLLRDIRQIEDLLGRLGQFSKEELKEIAARYK